MRWGCDQTLKSLAWNTVVNNGCGWHSRGWEGSGFEDGVFEYLCEHANMIFGICDAQLACASRGCVESGRVGACARYGPLQQCAMRALIRRLRYRPLTRRWTLSILVKKQYLIRCVHCTERLIGDNCMRGVHRAGPRGAIRKPRYLCGAFGFGAAPPEARLDWVCMV